MSVLTDLLAEIIGRLDPDDQPGLLALLGSLDADRVDQFLLDESVTSHESALDDGADGISFTTVRQSRPSSVFLAWEGVQGVSGHGYYELQFSTTASTAGLVYTAQQQSTWHITDALAFGTTYHVRGRAVDAAGHVGAWGSWQSLQSLQTVTDDLGDGTVTTVKIGNAQITTAKIADASITTAKIGNAQITNAKIDSLSASKITAGTISASSVGVDTLLTLSGTGQFRTGSGQDRIVFANGFTTEQRFYRSNVVEGTILMSGPDGDDLEINANRELRLITGEGMTFQGGNASFTHDVNASGEVRAGNGSVSAPGFGFISETDTGFYRVMTNYIATSLGGSNHYEFTVDGFRPNTGKDNTLTCGGPSRRWSEVYAGNGVINTSDEGEKAMVRPSSLGLDFILALEPITWYWPDGTRPHHGLGARQVKSVLDRLGIDFAGFIDPAVNDDEGPLGLRYHEFIGPIVTAIQDLERRISA